MNQKKSLIQPQLRFKKLCEDNSRIWMGIVNLSPNSILSSPSHLSVLKKAQDHIKNGAHILDIGAAPTNPSVSNALLPADIEYGMLYPVLKECKKEFGQEILFSVDTFSPLVAYRLAQEGLIDIVNDVYSARKKETFENGENREKNSCDMLDVVAKFSLGYIMMHMFGDLQTCSFQKLTSIETCLSSIFEFFKERRKMVIKRGVDFCVFDPGIGGGRFGKTLEQNLAILSEDFLKKLQLLGFPILIGLSRKSFLCELNPFLTSPESRDFLSKELEYTCFDRGVKIIRTHTII